MPVPTSIGLFSTPDRRFEMKRARAAASADSAGAPASGALTVQISAQSDNFSPRTGRQSAAVATNLIEVGTPRAPGRRQRASRHRAPRYPCGRRDRATLASGGGARAGSVSARRGRHEPPATHVATGFVKYDPDGGDGDGGRRRRRRQPHQGFSAPCI